MLRLINSTKYFLALSLIFFALMFFVESNNGSFLLNDFKVYYGASADFIAGNSPYQHAYGLSSGFYKYSPFSLILFSPYTLLPIDMAKMTHFIVTGLTTILCFLLIFRIIKNNFQPDIKRSNIFLSILFLTIGVHLTRELHLGNVNIFMIALFLVSVYNITSSKPILSAVFIALLLLLKPYFLIILLPIFIAKKWKTLGFTFLFSFVLLIFPAIFTGFSNNLNLLKEWANSMSGHAESMYSEHTFSSIIELYFNLELKSYWQFIFIVIAGLSYMLIRWSYFFGKRIYTSQLLISDLFILLALIPNLVITDSQHFLFSLPLIGLVVYHLSIRGTFWTYFSFIILVFFYGGNSNDLLGNPLSDLFDSYSTIGLSNLGLIILLKYLDWRATSFSKAFPTTSKTE